MAPTWQTNWGGLLFLVAGMLAGRWLTWAVYTYIPGWKTLVDGWTTRMATVPVLLDTLAMAVFGALVLGLAGWPAGYKIGFAGAAYGGGADW